MDEEQALKAFAQYLVDNFVVCDMDADGSHILEETDTFDFSRMYAVVDDYLSVKALAEAEFREINFGYRD